MQKGQGCLLYLLAVEKSIWVPLKVFSLKKSSAEAFVGLSRKTKTRDRCCCRIVTSSASSRGRAPLVSTKNQDLCYSVLTQSQV